MGVAGPSGPWSGKRFVRFTGGNPLDSMVCRMGTMSSAAVVARSLSSSSCRAADRKNRSPHRPPDGDRRPGRRRGESVVPARLPPAPPPAPPPPPPLPALPTLPAPCIGVSSEPREAKEPGREWCTAAALRGGRPAGGTGGRPNREGEGEGCPLRPPPPAPGAPTPPGGPRAGVPAPATTSTSDASSAGARSKEGVPGRRGDSPSMAATTLTALPAVAGAPAPPLGARGSTTPSRSGRSAPSRVHSGEGDSLRTTAFRGFRLATPKDRERCRRGVRGVGRAQNHG
jgi:hypothetical protein